LKRLIALLLVLSAASALAQVGERPGPTILSRGLGAFIQGGGELLRVKPFFTAAGVYDSGLTPFSVDSQGKIPVTNGYGVSLGFGVNGYHRWRRTLLGIDYRGDLRHYNQKNYYDGSNHTLALSLTHQPKRWLTFNLAEAASTYSRSPALLAGYQVLDPAATGAPLNEIFNGRTDFSNTMASVTFSPNRRLSFGAGGGGTIVRRRGGGGLAGLNSWSGHGDVQYTLGRSFSIGSAYSFSHYQFTNQSGVSDIHSVSLNLAFRLGRAWDLGLSGGASRVASSTKFSILLDPVLAALFGQTSFIMSAHNLNYIASAEARLGWVGRRSRLTFAYNTGATPGNGIYLTSRLQGGSVDWSVTAGRRWNFGSSARYSTYSPLIQRLGVSTYISAGGGCVFQVKSWLHLTGDYSARRYRLADTMPQRVYHAAFLGVAFSPGEVPLSLW
jgi:hypothetical protein